MNKYAPLTSYLSKLKDKRVTLTFEAMRKLLEAPYRIQLRCTDHGGVMKAGQNLVNVKHG